MIPRAFMERAKMGRGRKKGLFNRKRAQEMRAYIFQEKKGRKMEGSG